MAYVNGRLPDSALAAVAGGRLRKDAALRWNAMNAYRRSQGLATVMPNGPDSTYRTYARQVYWRRYWCSLGKCGNAAVPGTSNHGWGLAVDTNMHVAVNATGAPYGWQKQWSDAQHEPWHFKWAGFGKTTGGSRYVTLRPGMRHRHVKLAKRILKRRGHKRINARSSLYGPRMVTAVREFQRRHQLTPDGIVGPATWDQLLKYR